MTIKYPVYSPTLNGNEKRYVNECLDSTWISSKGKFISLFEEAYAQYIGIGHACAVCNGTVAIHLALLALGIGKDDEVIVPTLTYVATANAVLYVNATPVFVDAEKETWQIDPAEIEKKITSKTKAILIAHLYGHPCDMDAIMAICDKHGLYLIEDCAEGIGTRYNNKHVGTFGHISTFSFYGNKTITTGEGGMVVSNSEELIKKVKHLNNQGMSLQVHYYHDVLGYNYRMTNICAAIGLAQLERIDEIIANKVRVAETYKALFEGSSIQFHQVAPKAFHSYWMCSILISCPNERQRLCEFLKQHGIETRPFFIPIHHMPYFQKTYDVEQFPVAKQLREQGINLPSYPDLQKSDIEFIAQKILLFIENLKEEPFITTNKIN